MRFAVIAYGGDFFRLCDLDTGEIDDLKESEIIDMAKEGYKIENIEFRNNKLVDIAKYTRIVNGKPTKDRYYIIDSKDNSHTICDYMGELLVLSNSEVLKIANNIINPIDLNIPITRKVSEKYSGEFIGEWYNKATACYSLQESKSHYSLWRVTNKCVENRLVEQDSKSFLELDVTKLQNNNGMTIYNGEILFGKVYTKVTSFPLLYRILSSQHTINEINKRLAEMEKERVNHACKRSKVTEIILPTTKYRYKALTVYNADIINNSTIQDRDLINKYIQIFNEMNIELWIDVPTKKGDFLLNRTVNKNGIAYKCISFTDWGYTTNIVSIEDVYSNSKNYINVQVNGNEIKVYGLDGIYRYDIEKVYGAYNSRVILSNKAAKAKVLGIEHSEDITEGGVLLKMKATSNILNIPERVKVIQKNSIELSEENKEIVFNGGVEKIYVGCFCNVYHNSKINIDKVHVLFNSKEAGINLIKAISKSWYIKSNCTLKYNRGITVEEMATLCLYKLNGVTIEANNCSFSTKYDDKDSVEVFKIVCSSIGKTIPLLGHRDKYELLKSPTQHYLPGGRTTKCTTLRDILTEYTNIRRVYIDIMSKYFSEKVNRQVSKILTDIRTKINSELDDYQ